MGPLHPACCAAPAVLFVWCCTAWCCALHLHCLVLCSILHCVRPAVLLFWAEGSGHCNALRRRLRAVGIGNLASHCLIAWGQWAVVLLPYTASLPEAVGSGPLRRTVPRPGGRGQRNSCNTPPQCPGAGGSGSPAMHCRTAWGQWAVDLLQYTSSLPGGSGRWTSCDALPHCLGAVGSGLPAINSLTAWGQWAVPPAI